MTRKFSSFLSAALLCLVTVFACRTAFASHLRGTSVSWTPTGTPGTVQFTLLYSQAGSNTVGQTLGLGFFYGDGVSGSVTATVTSVNSAEGYYTASAIFTHAYTSVGPFTAYYQACCRVSTTTAGSGQTLRMETLVTPFANPVNHAPVVVSPAIITVPIQSSVAFNIFATDQDGDPLQYRLATPMEQYDSSTTSCSTQTPPGLTISNTGVATWDTTRITQAGCNYPAPVAGAIWPVQFMIEDLDANNNVKSKVPVDVLLKFVAITQPAPTLTFTPSGTLTSGVGTPITFTAAAVNTTPGSRITLNAVGLPTGAVTTNTNQTLTQPVNSVFTWKPTSAQLGTYLIVYTATNDTYEQSVGSVAIRVQAIQPPVSTCAASLNTKYNLSTPIPLHVSDPQGEALTVVWSVDGAVVHTDNVAASASASTLSFSQAFTTLGSHTVSVTTTNTDNSSSSCSTSVGVGPADQGISFNALPSITYGDADLALGANATSGLPVTLAATGSCSITGNTLHASGAGTCTVTASQAGNADYNAATSVTRSTIVATRSITVTATDATRLYGTPNSAFTGKITGVQSNDVITATYSSTATTSSSVGKYAIVPALAGTGLSNYSVTLNNGTLTVTPATLTVTAVDASRTYGGANPALTGHIVGVLNNDPVTATYSTSATASSKVGTYPIVPTLSGASLSNYTVSVNNGNFVVTPAALIVTAQNATRIYGTQNPTFAGAVTGGGSGDGITATYSCAATATSNVGSYAIVPRLSGEALSNYTVTTNNGTLTISKASLGNMQLVTSASPVFLQTAVTLQATLSSPTGLPTGSVTFVDSTSSAPLGTVALTNGVAQLSLTSLSVGSHAITATYSGDTNFNVLTSTALSEQVADLTLALNANTSGSTSQTLMPGGTASYAMLAAPMGLAAFPSDVTFSAEGLPAGATYNFSPQEIVAGSGATQIVLDVKVPSATAKLEAGSLANKLAPLSLAVFFLPLSRRLRRRAGSLGSLVAVFLLLIAGAGAMAGLSGCSSQNGFLTQAQKTYNLTVTATSGTLSRTTSLQLTVQ